MDNDNYNDIDYEEFREKKRGPVFRVFRGIVLFFVALFCVFLGARIHINNTVPEGARPLLWDEQAFAAYTAAPQEFAVFEHPIGSYTHPETEKSVIRNNMTADAYFSFSNVCYAPAVSQVQLTLRYNESTVAYLMEDYGLSEKPEGELFLFCLEDEQGKRYYDYDYTTYAKKFLGQSRYQYRRLLFRGINAEQAETLTLKIYYIGDTEGYKEETAEYDALIDEIVVYDKTFERVAGRFPLEFDPPEQASSGLAPTPYEE